MPSWPSSVDAYYADAEVRARVAEGLGGGDAGPTAAFVAVLSASAGVHPTWEHASLVPSRDLSTVWERQGDLARSLWDARHLVFVIELDYENIDEPATPFHHPADVFLKLEPAYRATLGLLRALDLDAQVVMTGRGYHFAGLIPLTDPLVDRLASILPETPSWFAGVEGRRPPGVTTPLTERQARAATGLGCLIEHLAHLVHAAASGSPIPVVLNGTVVGKAGPIGRECVSIDFSHVGDPLDVRHMRVGFSTYQWHRLRPDIFGAHTADSVPPLVALPRGRHALMAMLTHGRDLDAAVARAPEVSMVLPNVARGIGRLLASYEASPLAAFHRRFYAERVLADERPAGRPLGFAPPCVLVGLENPNDLLLKPEHLQHLVRFLLSQRWSAAENRPARAGPVRG